MIIDKSKLRKANPDNVLRLAKWLGLDTNGMSIKQVIKFIYWRVKRDDTLFQ